MNYTDAGYVYAITNKVNGKQYVGSTICRPVLRWNTHKSLLRRKVHHSYKLQSGWTKYGEQAFEFRVLFVCPKAQVLEYETRLLPTASYNIVQDSVSGFSSRRWKGHVKKIKPLSVPLSLLRSAEWKNPDIRKKRIDGQKLQASLPEAKAKKSTASTGRKQTKETVEKIARSKWKPLYCPEIQTTFLCGKYAAEYFGVLSTSVCNAVKQKGKLLRKYSLVMVA